jgi:hypothetical protein
VSGSGEFVAYVASGALAGLLSIAELVSRYKDKPIGLFTISGAWTYAAVNIAASFAALWLVHAFGWTFGQKGDALLALQVLIAGLGAAAVFRSSFFLVKLGDDTVGVGPSLVLTALLNSADRSIDRKQAERRLKTAGTGMRSFPFANRNALVTACLAAAANVSADDAVALRDSVQALADASADDTGKSLTLGLLIIDVMGPDVLKSALDAMDAS